MVGQQRFPSSRPFSAHQSDSFDLGGVTLIYLEEAQPDKFRLVYGFVQERKGSSDLQSPGLLWGLTVKVCFLLCVLLV